LDASTDAGLVDRAATVIRGHGPSARLGWTAGLGDINGDGLDDPVLGTRYDDTYLYYSPLPSGTLTTHDHNARFGVPGSLDRSTRMVNDLDNDGFADFVISLPATAAYIFYGQPTE
jgi:hypothetical protein